METALNQQVNAELWSSYLYLSMSQDMDHKDWEGMSAWFAVQAKEEFGHAARIMKFIRETGGKVKLMPLEEVRQDWNDPMDAFADTLMHEKIVTAKVHKLMDLAVELKDYAAQSMLKWFVDEQIEEENTARKILETLKKIEKSTAGMYALDRQLGKRVEGK